LQPIDVPAIAFDRVHHCVGPLFLIQAVLPSGHVDPGREALQTPFPRADCDLIEIVQIEDDVTLLRAVKPEIVNVRIAAHDRMYAGDWSLGKVPRHYTRGAAQKHKRGSCHASHAQRNQVLLPSYIAGRQQVERIGAVGSVALARASLWCGQRQPGVSTVLDLRRSGRRRNSRFALSAEAQAGGFPVSNSGDMLGCCGESDEGMLPYTHSNRPAPTRKVSCQIPTLPGGADPLVEVFPGSQVRIGWIASETLQIFE
jgi:hypothetical protein